ncbi:TRAP transporter small permease [Roseobacteraceae bacterium S113]
MRNLARLMALVGGCVLTLLILMVCASILGRELGAAFPATGLKPILGDFELVEAGIAFAIFCFLPLAQIEQGHAVVDVFTQRFPRALQRGLIWGSEVLFALVLIVIAVQLFAGLQSKMASGQTTFLLQFPIWWAYALSFVGAVVAAMVGAYMAAMRTAELICGRALLPDGAGAEH